MDETDFPKSESKRRFIKAVGGGIAAGTALAAAKAFGGDKLYKTPESELSTPTATPRAEATQVVEEEKPIDYYVEKDKLDMLIQTPLVNRGEERSDINLDSIEDISFFGDCRMKEFLADISEGEIEMGDKLKTLLTNHQSEALTGGLGIYQIRSEDFAKEGKTLFEREIENSPDAKHVLVYIGSDDEGRSDSGYIYEELREQYIEDYKKLLEEIIENEKVPIPVIMPGYFRRVSSPTSVSGEETQKYSDPFYSYGNTYIDFGLLEVFKELDIPYINLYNAITDYETPLNANDDYQQVLADGMEELFSSDSVE